MRKKYRPLFAKQLQDGLRRDGKSIEECCIAWGVATSCYYDWKKKYPKFEDAAEIGERDASAFWARKYRAVATGDEKGNAGLLVFAAKNVMGWADKAEVTNNNNEELRTITINMLPKRPEPKVIEHDSGEGS